MGSPRAGTWAASDGKTRRTAWEVEAKVSLSKFVAFGGRLEVSEHKFFYDENDEYLYSVTSNDYFKRKTDSQVIAVGGVQVHVRREEVRPLDEARNVPRSAGFRMVTRHRQQLRGPLDCSVTFDDVECGGVHLYQLEVEFSQSEPSNILQLLSACRRVTDELHLQITKLPHDIRVGFVSPTKYDWAKSVMPLLPHSTTHKGYLI